MKAKFIYEYLDLTPKSSKDIKKDLSSLSIGDKNRMLGVNESVSDVLIPKDEKELEKLFRPHAKMSWNKYLQYAKELENLGVKINQLWSWRIHKMEIETYRAFAENWNIGTALTKQDALAMIQAHKQYSYENHTYKIEPDHAYVDPHDLKNLILKMRLKIHQSTKYINDKVYNLRDKRDYPEYDEWYHKNRELVDKRRMERWTKEEEIDESVESVLRPKEEKEIIKDWPKDWEVTYKQFMKTKEQLEDMGVNVLRLDKSHVGPGVIFRCKGFQIFHGNTGILRLLTKKDAEEVVNILSEVNYDNNDFNITDEIIHLYYDEARNYVVRRGYKIKTLPYSGEKRRL